MAPRSSARSSLHSLSDLGALEDVLLCCGAWHLPASTEVLKPDEKVFSYKAGPRRIVLRQVNGPNALAYARTTSGVEGLAHQAHRHPDFACLIDADDSRVVVKFPVRVKVASLSQETYSCLEPDDTELARHLDRWRQR